MTDPTSSARRHVLVTGGNRGIGFATAAELLRRGHSVTFTFRDPAGGGAAADRLRREHGEARLQAVPLDLASFASIRRCAAALADGNPLDVLVHNAGALVPPASRRLSPDGAEETLQVHALGPLLLTTMLAPRLRRPARFVFVTSSLHAPGSHGDEVRFDFHAPDLGRGYSPERAYKNAKLAQIWLTREWERRHGIQGIHADAVSPGFVPATVAPHTRGKQRLLIRYVLRWMPFATSVREAARTVADRALRPGDEPGGRYFDRRTPREPSPDARDPEQAAAFWSLAEKRLGMTVRIDPAP